ncbi:MAG: ADP-ribosylglycohydrolase family protein [Nitrospirae bacterium]|nr:MAG: ADP-ribosylglycohydrolase family protein [Nitrospirota bacterium]
MHNRHAESPSRELRLAKALRSLDGLSVGDAFGELFFTRSPHETSTDLPPGPWRWTDDTHMALSIVEVLETYGRIEQDALAQAFARRFTEDPYRGYGSGARRLLQQLAHGGDWRELSPKLFGSGSYGNGAAMRVAPVGAFFYDDLQRAAHEAQLSAVITHAHLEGQVGAMAVAVAAALAANDPRPTGRDFMQAVLPLLPRSITKDRLRKAADIPPGAFDQAVRELGTGSQVMAQDTVPFCLWNAAYHLDDFEAALWSTVKGMGDCDTTCAIVGGIVALSSPEIPAVWLERREPLTR